MLKVKKNFLLDESFKKKEETVTDSSPMIH